MNRSLMGASLEAGWKTEREQEWSEQVVLVFIVDNLTSAKNSKLVEKNDDCCNVFQIAYHYEFCEM